MIVSFLPRRDFHPQVRAALRRARYGNGIRLFLGLTPISFFPILTSTKTQELYGLPVGSSEAGLRSGIPLGEVLF